MINRLHGASDLSDYERRLRKLALAWEDYYLPKFPLPFFQVRVADVRAAGGALSTALELYEEVCQPCCMWVVVRVMSLVISEQVLRGIDVGPQAASFVKFVDTLRNQAQVDAEKQGEHPQQFQVVTDVHCTLTIMSSSAASPTPSFFHLALKRDSLRFFQNWKHARAFANPFSWPMLPTCAPEILNAWQTSTHQRQLLNYNWLQAIHFDQDCELLPEVCHHAARPSCIVFLGMNLFTVHRRIDAIWVRSLSCPVRTGECGEGSRGPREHTP